MDDGDEVVLLLPDDWPDLFPLLVVVVAAAVPDALFVPVFPLLLLLVGLLLFDNFDGTYMPYSFLTP